MTVLSRSTPPDDDLHFHIINATRFALRGYLFGGSSNLGLLPLRWMSDIIESNASVELIPSC